MILTLFNPYSSGIDNPLQVKSSKKFFTMEHHAMLEFLTKAQHGTLLLSNFQHVHPLKIQESRFQVSLQTLVQR